MVRTFVPARRTESRVRAIPYMWQTLPCIDIDIVDSVVVVITVYSIRL